MATPMNIPKEAVHKMMNGPIPGENFTSDTKNYPWHRPPEYTNMDDAIDFAAKRLLDKKNGFAILTMLELGMTVTQVTDIFVTSGIGGGKWTPDFALLLAGPVAHIVKLMADGYGIDYEMGYEDQTDPITKGRFKDTTDIDQSKVSGAIKVAKGGLADVHHQAADTPAPVENATPAPATSDMGGFMSMAKEGMK